MSRNIAKALRPLGMSAEEQVIDPIRNNNYDDVWHEGCLHIGVDSPHAPNQPAAEPNSQEANTDMNATNTAISITPEFSATARRPGLLGGLALLLWVVAVCLGIVAPLAGIHIGTTLVVSVLVASGVASILSLPAAAGFIGRADSEAQLDPRRHP